LYGWAYFADGDVPLQEEEIQHSRDNHMPGFLNQLGASLISHAVLQGIGPAVVPRTGKVAIGSNLKPQS